jgi:predicted amidohydrolase
VEHVSIDLWAANLEAPVPDLESWMARVDARLANAAARGVHLLALPEFACAQWLSFAPADLPANAQLGWLADVGVIALETLTSMSERYGVSVLPGTIPARIAAADGSPAFMNRAWLLSPDRRALYQDKLSLTPLEANGAAGVTVAGDTINIMSWNGLRVAIPVCLDAEFTSLWSRLGELDLDLIIIPAKTDMITGYNRVFGCARARAIELQTAICVVGAVGEPLGHPITDTGVGGAAAYLPCDVSISLDGIHAALLPQPAAAYTDPLLFVQDLPVGLCRRLRNGHAEAEVCPAAWDASHVIINDI